MPVETTQLGPGIAAVALSGRLVLGHDIDRLETLIGDLVKQAQHRIVLDLSALNYADSAGIGAIVSCVTQLRAAGGELRVAGANPKIRRLFSMTGIDTLMPMFASVAEAASA